VCVFVRVYVGVRERAIKHVNGSCNTKQSSEAWQL
jgi:hypothetical protein